MSSILILVLLGLAVHLLLPQITELKHSIQVIKDMHLWGVGLAVCAQILGYLGSGILLQAVVALEKPAGGEIRSTSNPSSGWTEASGLSGVLSVNDLLEVNGKLYAATRHTSNGQIYQSDLAGLSWSNLDTISPSVTSIPRLILGAHGQILAGAENSNGSSNTTVFRNNAGQHSWTPYNGWMDMATSVYDLLSTDQGLYAATGYIYGNLFRVPPDNLYWRYLPLVRR